MKAVQIIIGNEYACKVSGQVVHVKVLGTEERCDFRDAVRIVYRCRNQKTGRDIFVRSPQRFRYTVREFNCRPSAAVYAGG